MAHGWERNARAGESSCRIADGHGESGDQKVRARRGLMKEEFLFSIVEDHQPHVDLVRGKSSTYRR